VGFRLWATGAGGTAPGAALIWVVAPGLVLTLRLSLCPAAPEA